MTTEKVLERLKERGHRVTSARTAIIDVLLRLAHPVTVAELRSALSRSRVRADKVTVYRELTILNREGVVLEVHFGDESKRYEIADRTHHHHVICMNCGRVEDVVLHRDMKKEERRIARKNRFTITRHNLEFFGLCASCR